MDKLERLRREINALDQQILKALASRREAANRVIRAKEESKKPLRDAQREEELLSRLIQKGKEHGLDAYFVMRVFHEIIDDSVRCQQLFLLKTANEEQESLQRVGFQGIQGAYSHLAAQKFFSAWLPDAAFTGYPTFSEVVQAVENESEDYGFLPIENTTAGSINEVYDLLSHANLSIIGEEVFRVQHCLLGIENVPLSAIRHVLSHPQALAQCMRFLSSLKNCKLEYFDDTAMAVRKVKQDQDKTQAAIASEDAGKRYGLKVLKRNLSNQPENFTRFFVVSRNGIRVDERIPAKTSLIIAAAHEEGALLKALSVLHRHRINLTKLESRPKPRSPFQYVFYLDFEGNTASERVRAALDELAGTTSFLKVLGCYPIEARGRTAPSVQALVSANTVDRPPGDVPRSEKPAAGSAGGAVAPAGSRRKRPLEPGEEAAGMAITVKGVRIGGPDFVVIAGPPAVESREQILRCAREVKECGGSVLRGGCFRPQRSASGFQGLGLEGLEMLAEAGREYNLPVITEVLSPADVEAVAGVADVLQVSARNMQNFSLLKEVGNVNRPVLLKRGMMSTLDEFLDAAEYIMAQGNKQVLLCERGIRTFETSTRNTLDLASVPILKRVTHLPIFVDPSRAAGQRDLVSSLALAARAVGPHGLMVEIHPDPEHALSDGPQALTFPDFELLMRKVFAAG